MRMTDANGLQLAVEVHGEGPPVVLVMGIGAQRVLWPDAFVQGLVDAGYQAIRFDNRDVGQSTWLRDAPVPPVLRSMMLGVAKLPVPAPYTLSDMALDVIGLLDALGLERAHVVGASMGGMIAQHVALEHPERVQTLTSIMSGPGSLRHMIGEPKAIRALLRPPPANRAEAQERSVELFRVIGGALPLDEDALRERAGIAWDRGSNPAGFARQWAAIMASGSRRRALRDLEVPTLVVHGTEDPLVPPRAGRATAEAIPGAKLVWIEGMGHDLAPAALPQILAAMREHLA